MKKIPRRIGRNADEIKKKSSSMPRRKGCGRAGGIARTVCGFIPTHALRLSVIAFGESSFYGCQIVTPKGPLRAKAKTIESTKKTIIQWISNPKTSMLASG